jgi:hypothetical protein
MIRRKHGKIVVPPYTFSTAKLLRGKMSFVGCITWQGQQGKLGFNGTNPSIRIQWLLHLAKKRGLHSKEI